MWWQGVGGVEGSMKGGKSKFFADTFLRSPENVGGVAGYKWGGSM